MLSRAAERVYWTGRYLERAENTARIVQQYSQLLLDLPDEVGVTWSELVRIVGAASYYDASGRSGSEEDVIGFLLADGASTSSLLFSLRMARENLRNTRDLLPQESWESVNELYQFAVTSIGEAVDAESRFEILSDCIGGCQRISGILQGTMSHHDPYHFLTIGRLTERADMTSRIIDVATAYIQGNEELVRRYGSSLWTNVLKSVSGFQMYRQYRQPQVVGIEVVDYLTRDPDFPRAIRFCTDRAKDSVHRLPRADATIAALDDVNRLLRPLSGDGIVAADISALMDSVQRRLGDVHASVVDTWFLPEGVS